MSTQARLNGTIFVSGTRSLYVGPLVATKRHAHHAAQIIIAPEGVSIEDAHDGHIRTTTAVIPPRLLHGHGACAHGALLFLDGDDPTSRELTRNAEPRAETWERTNISVTVPRDTTPDQARSLIVAMVSALDPREPPKPRHPASRRMSAFLDGRDHGELASLSHEAGLSPRQMRHTFARDMGLSMRAYARWRCLRRAIAAVEQGASLTEAAASAGFADSAHLSRVFREQFGMTPTQGLSSVTWRMLD
jgi:AraC-like DNA-binding protein